MPKPKQEEMPIEGEGVAPKRIKAIDVAADKYVEIRDTRMEWTEKECKARDNLVAKMKEHGLSMYRYGDHEVVLKEGDPKVKVKNVDATVTAGEAEDEET